MYSYIITPAKHVSLLLYICSYMWATYIYPEGGIQTHIFSRTHIHTHILVKQVVLHFRLQLYIHYAASGYSSSFSTLSQSHKMLPFKLNQSIYTYIYREIGDKERRNRVAQRMFSADFFMSKCCQAAIHVLFNGKYIEQKYLYIRSKSI